MDDKPSRRSLANTSVLHCYDDDVGQAKSLRLSVISARQNLQLGGSSFVRGSLVRGSSSLKDSLLEDGATGTLTPAQTIFNIANIIVGVGVLSVPYAFKQSGYFALVLIVGVIGITGTAGKWIGESIGMVAHTDEARRRPPEAWDFTFLAEMLGGRKFGLFINIAVVLEIWLALVAFMVMNGGNASVVWPELSKTTSVPLLGIIGTLFIFVPPQLFSYLSLISSLAMVVAAAAMAACTYMLPEWANPYDHMGAAALLNVENIPRSVGIIIFCFAGHPCFPSVWTGMASPERWGYCIDSSFAVAFVYYASFGFLGYIVFGADLAQTVTENLVEIEGARAGQIIAAFCFLIKVQLTLPLLLNAVIVSLWAPGLGEPQWPLGRIVLVMVVGCITILVALALADKVAVVASLAGCALVMITSVLFPALVHLGLAWRFKGKQSLSSLVAHGVVIGFGFVFMLVGTAQAIGDLAA